MLTPRFLRKSYFIVPTIHPQSKHPQPLLLRRRGGGGEVKIPHLLLIFITLCAHYSQPLTLWLLGQFIGLWLFLTMSQFIAFLESKIKDLDSMSCSFLSNYESWSRSCLNRIVRHDPRAVELQAIPDLSAWGAKRNYRLNHGVSPSHQPDMSQAEVNVLRGHPRRMWSNHGMAVVKGAGGFILA